MNSRFRISSWLLWSLAVGVLPAGRGKAFIIPRFAQLLPVMTAACVEPLPLYRPRDLCTSYAVGVKEVQERVIPSTSARVAVDATQHRLGLLLRQAAGNPGQFVGPQGRDRPVQWLPDVPLVQSEPEEGPQGRLQALPCRAALLAGFRQDKLLDFLAVQTCQPPRRGIRAEPLEEGHHSVRTPPSASRVPRADKTASTPDTLPRGDIDANYVQYKSPSGKKNACNRGTPRRDGSHST